MTNPSQRRNWYLNGVAVSATASTRQRLDSYELGIAALAAIELEEEFPSVAVSTRLRRAAAVRAAALVTA